MCGSLAGEADVAQLAGAARVEQGEVRAFAVVEDAVGIVEADDLVVLDEIDAVGAQPPQGVVELARGHRARSPVDLRHHEYAAPAPVGEALPTRRSLSPSL